MVTTVTMVTIGGWPSARLFGWSAADWSRPAFRCIHKLRKKKNKSSVLLRKDVMIDGVHTVLLAEILLQTAIYGVRIWFWPTLHIRIARIFKSWCTYWSVVKHTVLESGTHFLRRMRFAADCSEQMVGNRLRWKVGHIFCEGRASPQNVVNKWWEKIAERCKLFWRPHIPVCRQTRC